ncbi:MAG: hypothetical protein ACRDLQ_03890 [Solirubrobacterales bacterium]
MRAWAILVAVASLALAPSAAAQELGRCDPFDPSVCLQPWPNDHFTVADPTTDTGRRVDLDLASMPRNAAGKPIDPTDFNRNDGFSPGQMIVSHVPGLDNRTAFHRTRAVPITDIARTHDKKQPVVVLNAATRKRHLIWSELDANPQDRENVNLLIRPAVNFDEGGRYIVALRNLKNAAGQTIGAPEAFRTYRDGIPTSDPAVEARRDHMEDIFKTLKRAGIKRKELYLAWDFTVASERNLSERMLHIRDDAFAQLGDTRLDDLTVQGAPPPFAVTEVTDFQPCGGDGCQEGESDRLLRQVEGRVIVPCYLDAPECPPGSRFAYGLDGLPLRIPGNVHPANFVCIVPRAAVAGDTVRPARPSLYGHGLLGSASQVAGGAIQALASEHNILLCATDWIGLSEEDLPNVVAIIGDLSHFSSLPDRGQQGMLNFLHLGRTMIHPLGFSTDPAFQWNGTPLIDTTRLYYDGGSQGGIMGGSLTAVAPDFTHAALGVPGMNYSTLLDRSIDFDEFAQILDVTYPNELERQLIFSLIQMLWDRAEANGYAHHMTDDPLPGTPPHEVLLSMAFGDHQVTNWATAVEARTIGARIRTPALDPGRSNEEIPYYGVPAVSSWPFNGSLFEVWDVGPLRTEGGQVKGTTAPPVENVPNRAGVDPHGPDASEEPAGRLQISEFLRPDGAFIDVCGDHPCYLAGWTGP